MLLSPVAAPSTVSSEFVSRHFVDTDASGTPGAWALTGLTEEQGATTVYTKSMGTGGRVQTWRLDGDDPRIAGAAALLRTRIDGLGDQGPGEQPGVVSYIVGRNSVDASGQLQVRAGFYPVAATPNAVLDVRAAAQTLRALLMQFGRLDRPTA